jgi:chromosome segregation ATPase
MNEQLNAAKKEFEILSEQQVKRFNDQLKDVKAEFESRAEQNEIEMQELKSALAHANLKNDDLTENSRQMEAEREEQIERFELKMQAIVAEQCKILKSDFEGKSAEQEKAVTRLQAELSMAHIQHHQSVNELKALYEENQKECKKLESKAEEMNCEFVKQCARQDREYESLKNSAYHLEGSLHEKNVEIQALQAQHEEQVILLKSKNDQIQELSKTVEEKEKKLSNWAAKRNKLAGVMKGLKAEFQQQQSKIKNSNQQQL